MKTVLIGAGMALVAGLGYVMLNEIGSLGELIPCQHTIALLAILVIFAVALMNRGPNKVVNTGCINAVQSGFPVSCGLLAFAVGLEAIKTY